MKNIHLFFCAVVFYVCGLFLLFSSFGKKFKKEENNLSKKPENFDNDLKQYSKDGVLFLSSVDQSYVDMAMNLYETSYKPLGIDNYLFLCSDNESYVTLHGLGINSQRFIHHVEESASIWGTNAFKFKTQIKTSMMAFAMSTDLTIILVDVDIVFLKNPVPYLNCTDCDIEIQNASLGPNSGFYIARPTSASKILHQMSLKTVTESPSIDDQKALGKHIKIMQNQGELKVRILNQDTFPTGLVYFEKKKRMFYYDNPPTTEVIVHNNWILTKAAKVYRFKESLLWMTDTDRYYSNLDRRYLYYSNPHDFGKPKTLTQETEALKTAFIIGHLFNRTVILPSFSCYGCSNSACKVPSHECNLLSHYSIAKLDTVLENKYREHVFLDHPLVPKHIKSETKTYFIKPANTLAEYLYTPDIDALKGLDILTPKNSSKGPLPDEILVWFSKKQEPVLKFHSLYNILNSLCSLEFCKEVQKAVYKKVNYRQFVQK